MPPQVPWVAGEPLQYHWYGYLHLAATSWVTGIEPDEKVAGRHAGAPWRVRRRTHGCGLTTGWSDHTSELLRCPEPLSLELSSPTGRCRGRTRLGAGGPGSDV